MSLYPNEMVPLQIDRAIGHERCPQAPTVNLSTGILAVPARYLQVPTVNLPTGILTVPAR